MPAALEDSGVKKGVFYEQRIEEEEEDEEVKKVLGQSPGQNREAEEEDVEDPDEIHIREQLRLRGVQHKQMLGLDEDDMEDEDNSGRQSNGSRLFMRRQSENR